MKEKKKTASAWRRYSGLFIVFFIVIGVAALAIASVSHQKNQAPAGQAVVQQTKVASKASALMLSTDNGWVIRSLDDSRRLDIKWPDDVSRLGLPLSQVQGTDLATGRPAWLDSGFVLASSTIWRSPDGRRNAFIASDRQDGTGTVEVRQGNESMILVLRMKNGRKVTDEQFLGWLDKDTMALTAIATSSRDIFTLDLNGVLAPVAQLPDDAWLVKAANDAVYYSRATPGEGIESPQSAPSSLWRADTNGNVQKLLDEPEHVIQNFVVDGDTIVYSLEDNSLKKWTLGQRGDLGYGQPLMALPGQGMICLQVGKLVLMKDDGQTIQLNDINPSSVVFYLPEASLDGNLQTK